MNEFYEKNGENKNNTPPEEETNLNKELSGQENNAEFHPQQNVEENPQNTEVNPQNTEQFNPQSPQNFYSQNNSQGYGQQPKVDPYGGNMNYQWNYDDYAKAVSKPKKNKGLTVFIVCICSVFGLALIGLIGVGGYTVMKDGFGGLTNTSSLTSSIGAVVNPNGPKISINSKPSGGTQVTTSGQLTIPQVVKAVSPSIVGIENFSLQSTDFQPTGEGSGIIISPDGYIVTNQHVIAGADTIKVVLENNKEVVAKLIGSDTKTDIAVLKIDGTGYPVASLGDSNALEVGETVIAIGNPGGMQFSHTVTQGIISAVNRSLGTGNFIQTDAAINPGNSGGALVNMFGQVIGITAQKIPSISNISAEGMGFAIPIVEVKNIVDTLIKYHYVKGRVTLGVTSCQDIDEFFAQANNVPKSIRVLEVDPASNAAKAGLKKNDFITKINDKTIETTDQLITERDKYKPGDTVTLTVIRYSTKETLKIKIVLAEDKGDTAAAPQPVDPYASN
jgi:serine protease Do